MASNCISLGVCLRINGKLTDNNYINLRYKLHLIQRDNIYMAWTHFSVIENLFFSRSNSFRVGAANLRLIFDKQYRKEKFSVIASSNSAPQIICLLDRQCSLVCYTACVSTSTETFNLALMHFINEWLVFFLKFINAILSIQLSCCITVSRTFSITTPQFINSFGWN